LKPLLLIEDEYEESREANRIGYDDAVDGIVEHANKIDNKYKNTNYLVNKLIQQKPQVINVALKKSADYYLENNFLFLVLLFFLLFIFLFLFVFLFFFRFPPF